MKFYLDALITCKNSFVSSGEGIDVSAAAASKYSFKVGDRVRVDLDVDILKTMQEGHGGWNPKMADVCIVELVLYVTRYEVNKILMQ